MLPGSALLDGVTDDMVRQANNYSAQHVAVTCWAFTKLEISPRPSLIQVHLFAYPTKAITSLPDASQFCL